MGTAKVVLPSSVDHAVRAICVKFSIPGRSFSATTCPALYRSNDLSKGRQAIRSPAVPPLSLASKTALYSVGGVGANTIAIFGCFFVNAGMIVSRQTLRSSLRQLSTTSWTLSSARTIPTPASATTPSKNAFFNMGVFPSIGGLPYKTTVKSEHSLFAEIS